MSEPRVQQFFLPMEAHLPGPSSLVHDSPSDSPPSSDPADLLRLIAEANAHGGYGIGDSPKTQLDRLIGGSMDVSEPFLPGVDVSAFAMPTDFTQFGDFSVAALRNSSKTLKCPKCNWHYKYQETLEIHMKEKHAEGDVKCLFCVENRPHPKLSRGETYSCGYKPYRCELCRYSTTTKGNLSIHMQSDKHLHAMQELPNSIASLGCQRTTRSPVQDGENAFVCLVCGCFSCESLQEMITHAEKDRSRPSSSDVSLSNGVFRCHLCPYNTNLKANFQLHTRTDKHLQRVQLVNHIREGSNAASALCRLGAAKSVFQVLCRPCQEILPTGGALRDHCEGVGHRTNLRQPLTIFRCRLCSFETQLKHEALGHMAVHEATTWPVDRIDLDAMAMDEDAAFGCASCGFTAKDANTLEEHARSHEEGEPCPLCNDRTTALNEHLINEHKISESAVEKLLQVHRIEPIGSSAYTFRCSRCSLAFRSESALHSHSVLHLFDQAQKCPHCSKVFNTSEELKIHTDSEHSKSEEETRCDLCAETFSSRQQFHAHINSVRHLHEAKKQLEQGSVSLNQQVLSALQNPTSPGEKKPFRCNVCKIGYGQGATLDIHLRSVAHQSRMNKLGDLVAAKEIDPTKPILEQPGGAPQKLIRELVTEEGGQASNMMSVFNLVNMFMGQNALSMPFGANLGEQADDDVGAPKTAADLLNMLKTFGIDRITVACPELLLKLGKLTSISDDQIASICRVDCTECGQTHSSIVLLGVHYQETHSSSMPDAVLKKFCDRLLNSANDAASPLNGHDSPQAHSRDSSEPPEKRPRSGPTPPEKPDLTQMAMLGMMGGFNPFMQAAAGNPFMAPAMQDFFNPLLAQQMAQMAQSPAKRARTRISDDQLKILRQYFDINNSPSEAQIKEMSLKAGLPEKVIKHWFRNTLFKERQRDKDSPYNFSIPPQVGIDLDAYEKTGETKVVPLTPEVKAEIKSEPSSGEQKRVEATLPQINLATMMQQMQQSPFSFMDPQALMHSQLPQLQQQQPTTTGRRANRTRFTDFQLRTLQQFFDKQAYPKDDDLEILSKKLQLSPRVIVVWFQNARQKARKIYENQPNHENSDRFLRTPGCNFQCKRCNLVFQRYYELIQHQQKVCYKDDGLALANDNKGVEEGLTEDEKALAQSASSSASASTSEIKPSPADLLKLLGGGKSSTEALLKMCESANLPSTASFNKRCPFCALLFKSKTNLVEHLTMRHAQQMIFAPVDVDSLPDAEDVPVLSCSDPKDLPGVLDLSSAGQDRESLSMSPSFFGAQSDGDDVTDCGDESTLASLVACATPGTARSPVSNKRYRTHLTPVQVHVMKSVFTDYKTPSMAECESLGRDIGLHKRVVQVWFQNARAKERKNRASNGENEEIFRSTATGCTLCGVDYVGRVTMQDHLFSAQHITALKGQTKNDGSTEAVENGDRLKASALLKPAKSQLGAMMNGFPFQFMNGMMNPSALPVMFDQSLFGVPVAVLQVPDDVKEQIKNEMAAGHSKSRFTHDGESVSTLKDSLSSEDAACLIEDDEEVGWGCPSCSNVFQLEQHLKNHQQQFCRGSETFTLVQTHYGCSACGARCGTQREFQQHVVSAEHKARLAASSSA